MFSKRWVKGLTNTTNRWIDGKSKPMTLFWEAKKEKRYTSRTVICSSKPTKQRQIVKGKKWNGVGPSLKVQMLMVSEGTINELAEQLMNNAKMSKAYSYFISHPVWKRPRPPKKETILHSAPEKFRLVELHDSKALILLLPLTCTNWNCQS